MTKRLLFVTAIDKDETDGVWKKVFAMARAFVELNYDVDLVYRFEGNCIIENISLSGSHRENVVFNYSKIHYYSQVANFVFNNYDLLYIRKPLGGVSSLLLFRIINKVLKINSKCKVCMEIPTYPYKKEVHGLKGGISELCFLLGRFLYQSKISLIPYMGLDVDKIWGVQACKISNGIDLSKLQLLTVNKQKVDNTIRFIAVARLSFWHGIDRLINAMARYRGKYNLQLTVVGSGEPEFSKLKKIVSELNIQDKVFFSGSLFGSQLYEVYNKAHIAVDSLGRHRTGTNENSSLKSKEYAALGIPFIKSHDDAIFDEMFFAYTVSSDENEINLDDIIKWYNNLPPNTPLIMREFAEENLSWKTQITYLLSRIDNC